jgi:hypothetical protein
MDKSNASTGSSFDEREAVTASGLPDGTYVITNSCLELYTPHEMRESHPATSFDLVNYIVKQGYTVRGQMEYDNGFSIKFEKRPQVSLRQIFDCLCGQKAQPLKRGGYN